MKMLRVVIVSLVVASGVVGTAAWWVSSRIVRPRPAPSVPWSSTVMAAFPESPFLEGLARRSDGSLVVTAVSPDRSRPGGLWRVSENGARHRLPFDASAVAVTADERVFVTRFDGAPSSPEHLTVALFELVGDELVEQTRFPQGAFINGMAFGPGDTLYAADSLGGRIFRWQRGGVPEVWREDERFKPSSLPGLPGLNGLRVRGGSVWTVNSSSGVLFRIPLSGGALDEVARELPGDGFDVDEDGAVFIATHPFNTIERIGRDGSRQTIGSSATGIVGPTDVLAVGPNELLIVQDGGAFLDLLPLPVRALFPSARREPQLVRLAAPP